MPTAPAEEQGAKADHRGEPSGDEGDPGRGHPIRHDTGNEWGIECETRPKRRGSWYRTTIITAEYSPWKDHRDHRA